MKSQVVENNRKYRNELCRLINEIKTSTGCSLCEENEVCCLELHHYDPNQKEFDISHGIRRKSSWEKIKEEIKKCVCLCSNCHRKVHAGLKLVNESQLAIVPDNLKPSWNKRVLELKADFNINSIRS